MTLRIPRETLLEGDIGHLPDEGQTNKRLSARGYVIDPYADAGLDPTGATDVTAGFTEINTWLAGKGGGVIRLPPFSAFMASLDLHYLVSVHGAGMSSRIVGPPGAAKPVVKADCYQNHLRNFMVVGTLPWDGTTGGNADPEIGMSLYKSGSWWAEPRVSGITIQLCRGPGFSTSVQGGKHRGLDIQACGGRGIWTSGGATDQFFSDCNVGGLLSGADAAIYAIGLGTQWNNVKAFAMGLIWDGTTWVFDPANTTSKGWALGYGQRCSNARSEDCAIGVHFQGADSRWQGSSGGDRIPVLSSNPSATQQNNVYEASIDCNDRFVPICGAQVQFGYSNKFTLNIDWESQSVAGPHAETGVKIKAKAGFKAVDDQSPGFGALYNANEYIVRGTKGWILYTASTAPLVGGVRTLTPDAKDGLRHYIGTDANLTIAAPVHRSAVQGGEKILLVFDAALTAGRVITLNAAYNNSGSPVTLPAGITAMEFTNVSPSLNAPNWRKTGQW